MTIVIDQRTNAAGAVQEVLTKNGCLIKTRLGLHEDCDETGLIILQLCGSDDEIGALKAALAAIDGISVQKIDLQAPTSCSCGCDCT
jgi:hypothetical protein